MPEANQWITRLGVGLTLWSCLQGCSAITDLDRFKTACDGDASQQRDFSAQLHNIAAFTGSQSLANTRIELRIVDSTLTVVARAVLNGFNEELESDSIQVFMPRAVPPGTHNVHLYVDINHNGRYDREGVLGIETGTEPSWIGELCSSGVFDFTANDVLQDIEDPMTSPLGGIFGLRMTELHPHLGGKQKLELLVFNNSDTTPAVGYFRHPGVTNTTMTAVIPGIIEANHNYRVDFYIDKNQNNRYDGHPTDHSWRLQFSPQQNALLSEWEHTGVFNDVEF